MMNSVPAPRDPVWNGKTCGDADAVDVGRGTGTCNDNCDCPPCAPFCSSGGYCQQTKTYGQRQCQLSSNPSFGYPQPAYAYIAAGDSYRDCPYGQTLNVNGNCVSLYEESEEESEEDYY